MRRAESLSLKSWIFVTKRMMRAVMRIFTRSKGVRVRILLHGTLLMGGIFWLGWCGINIKCVEVDPLLLSATVGGYDFRPNCF